MKKIFLLALAAAVTVSASAEGYQVNTLSAKQLGMGHTGVSQKLDSESLWFNPAAAAYQEQKFSIAAGVTGINAVATGVSLDGSATIESDNDLSTPLYLNLNYKVNDNLAIGLSFNTPYGSSMNWNDNWAGAHLVQNITLQSYTAQPTISYKMFDGKLSIGAGLMISWGNFELSRSLFPVGSSSNAALQYGIVTGVMDAYGLDYDSAVVAAADMLAAVDAVGDNPLASATLSGDAALAFGVNLGAMYEINEKWSLGVSYRSKMMMKVDAGDAELAYANDVVKSAIYSTIEIMDKGSFTAELPLPSTLSWGVSFRPNNRWEIALDMQCVGWSAYDSLDVEFHEDELGDYSINAEKAYKNTMIYRIGAQFAATEWLTARAGFYYDESPVSSDHLNPETPSMNKLGYTCGMSFMPCKNNRNLSIDLAYAFITPASYDRQGSYTDTNKLTGAEETFSGVYRAVANTFSIGVSWGF